MRNVFWMYLTKNSAKFRAIGHVQLRTSKWRVALVLSTSAMVVAKFGLFKFTVSFKHWQSYLFVDSGKRNLRPSNTICKDHLIFQLDH